VERLGDYAKNLAQLAGIRHEIFPLGPKLDELLSVRRGVQRILATTPQIIKDASHDAGTTTALILGARFYKRICGHLLNVLTSVVMPLDKVDYFDEPLVLEDTSDLR